MKVQVVGGGSFGLALTKLLAEKGHAVRLWCRGGEQCAELQRTHTSAKYLPGIQLPEKVVVDSRVDAAAEMVVLAVPSHALREILGTLAIPRDTIRVSVVKGIENETLMRMSEVIAQAAPGGPVVALSGPSHAEEVARDMPTSVVVAGSDAEICEQVQEAFFTSAFRVYTSGDLAGVELGGALKNVIAIAAGVCDGLGFGDNAKAALITRGLAEIARLGVACGADPITFAGLSGMGDLIVTCESRHSRNRAVGEALARGQRPEDATGGMVAEGVRTTRSACALAQRVNIDMPIARAVYAVLYEGAQPGDAVANLMMRGAKPERY